MKNPAYNTANLGVKNVVYTADRCVKNWSMCEKLVLKLPDLYKYSLMLFMYKSVNRMLTGKIKYNDKIRFSFYQKVCVL